ncbi:MAG: hypothetical protein ACK5QX_04455, partial [bacterium]
DSAVNSISIKYFVPKSHRHLEAWGWMTAEGARQEVVGWQGQWQQMRVGILLPAWEIQRKIRESSKRRERRAFRS